MLANNKAERVTRVDHRDVLEHGERLCRFDKLGSEAGVIKTTYQKLRGE